MTLKVQGSLLLGLPYQGKLYHQCQVHILTMGLECEVIEVINALPLKALPETKANTLIDLAYLSKQFSVEGIPADVITPEYLLEHLSTDDYELIMTMISDLRKKRMLAGESPTQTQNFNQA